MRVVLLAFLIFAAGSLHAEAVYEPVYAAGDFHVSALENEQVRVLEVTILPGETVPLHQHTMPSIFITLQPASLIFRDAEGNIVRKVDKNDFGKMPHLEWRGPAPAPRTVTNTDSVSMRALRVELKGNPIE